ncbi:DPP IV N-terminal domain-containing protein [Streptomyces uncialis]|uniref:S9 family peptidase n=1 Tax=Streptomyces uncialis TaxID=1048205 RepID=UPI00386A80A4|nr:DPP IV N-terminal domain-containing protein [Streptomyces uncialis]
MAPHTTPTRTDAHTRTAPEVVQIEDSVYATAESLLRHNRRHLVLGGRIRPNWTGDGSRFWYTVATDQGPGVPPGRMFMTVDTRTGARTPAFDHERLAVALAKATGQRVEPAHLPFESLEPTERAGTGADRGNETRTSGDATGASEAIAVDEVPAGGSIAVNAATEASATSADAPKAANEASVAPILSARNCEPPYSAVEFDTPEGHWRCDLSTYAITRIDGHRPASFLDMVSPNGRWAVRLKDHNLWLRDQATGMERPLTTDGEQDHEYGLSPFSPQVLLGRIGLPHLPPALVWSSDSTRVLTHLTDQRDVRRTHTVDHMPDSGGAPELRTQRYAYPGDERMPTGELVVLDIATGDTVRARTEPLSMPLMSPITTRWACWDEDGSAVHFLRQSRDVRTLTLERMDPATGEVRTLVTETGPTRVEPAQQQSQKPMVRVLSGGAEVLWYSQRDNWGHLYLYDTASGRPATPVTTGSWAVQEILRVDEQARTVDFVASGLVVGDPYRRTVCRTGLDGTGLVQLTDDGLDHEVTVTPAGDRFIDSASTQDVPPVITVRDWDGLAVVMLEKADISRLRATGWTPPERFTAKAADGVTDIHGVLYRPHGFDPERSYPVIDHPYPGPHMRRVSSAFDPGVLGHDAEAVAALGFVVIAVDGRGTPGRDKAFHDASYARHEAAGGLEDHVAAIRQLGAERPWMDLDRVGAFGLSGGGYATVRAMASFPEFFKVGVAEAGNHENRFYHLWWAETYDGPAAEEDYIRSSNVEVADRIEGKLLLIHGGMDDNVHPHHTLRLADALVRADKDFDLLIVPRAEHAFFGYEHYVSRRRWDYFLRHLLGAEPPKTYRLTPPTIDAELLKDIFS